MSKLRSVIRHEYLTIVKQPSFWIMMIAIPAVMAVVFLLSYFSSQSSSSRIEELTKDLKNVAIVDESGLLNKEVVKQSGLTLSDPSQVEALQEAVRTSEKEALIVFPESLKQNRSYSVYLSSDDLMMISTVTSLGNNLLKTSLFLPLGSAEVIALAQDGAQANTTVFKDGKETGGFNDYIAPGLFVVLFYIIFAFSVGYMLSSVSEEKENRSMEMVLTYVKPRTLIVGKLLAVSLVTLTQITFFAVLGILAYILALQSGASVALPFGINLAEITLNPLSIFFGFAYLVVGFLMYAGFMTATAAAAPSTKEANSFSAVFFIGAFIPFYFVTTVATDPTNPIVTFLTHFPLTSPVVTLIRNTLGNMTVGESWLALLVMTAFMLFSIWVAVRAFKLGALEFNQVINLRKLFKRD